MTLKVMEHFGISVGRQYGKAFFVAAGQSYVAQSFDIEGDFSSASYFFLAAALGLGESRCPV
jgi:3-phosphoshikimate 1-carboxyvinyltransferase